MTDEKSSRRGLTRRSFLKSTAAAAGAVAVAGAASPTLTALAEGDTETSTAEHTAKCCCRCNCFGSCYIEVTVRDGKAVNLRPAAMKDEHYNRVCLRGLSHLTRIYDPDRVKYPMKRVGERGGGEWECIGWDEAIQLMADRFTEIREQYGNQAIAFWTALGNSAILNGGGGTPNFMTRFFNYIQGTDINASVDMAGSVGQTRVLGGNYSSGLSDLVNSHTIICWGYNATESTMHTWHLIADGMDAGAKLIVIDPTYTKIAAKADQWIPIRPGTDTALALSLMQVLYSEGLHDRDFLLKYTCAPFLVKDDDGLYLRMSDLGVEPSEGPVNAQTGKPTVVDPIVVWDETTGGGVAADEAVSPALEGAYEVGGLSCHTAFSLLREEFDQYPPDVAESITEVPADVIVELAERLAEGPVAHLLGYGSQAYGNGVHIGMVMATLPAMTGNYGYPGAQEGAHWKFFSGFNNKATQPEGKMRTTISHFFLSDLFKTGKLGDKDFPLKALWVFSTNPLAGSPGTKVLTEEIWPNFDFVVVSDLVMTDTAKQADLVLPVPHFFEQEDVHTSGEHGFIFWTEKAIDPLYEAKTDSQIVRLLAEKMGMGDQFSMTDDEYMQEALDSQACKNLGITLEALKEQGCMYDGTNPSIPAKGLKFKTGSGRIEFYCEKPAPRMKNGLPIDVERERLPRFFPPIEAWSENELAQKYPIILNSERPRFRVHTQWFASSWLRQLEPDPIVKMNPEDAEARGLKDDDWVEVYNDRGHVVVKLVVSSAIRKGMAVYPKGWQAYQHKAGSWSELLSREYDPAGINGNFMDNLCEIRLWEEE